MPARTDDSGVGTTYGERNPFEVLGVASDTEWRVIQAAYEMLVERARKEGEGGGGNAALADIEWAYETLRDPEKRLGYAERNLSKMNESGDKLRIGGETDVHSGLNKQANLVSVLVSSVIFGGMLAAVGYALYFVGAVRPPADHGDSTGSVLAPETTKLVELATEIPADHEAEVFAHTATVEALYTTATRGALLDYTAGLTATMEAFKTSLTPTPVEIRACPNVASVNVRTGPGIAYRAIGYILAGDCVDLTGRDEENKWIVIYNAPRPSSDGGWVAVSLMNVEGDIYDLRVVVSE